MDAAAGDLAELDPWQGVYQGDSEWLIKRRTPYGPAPEGPRARLVVSPGAVAIERRDPARAERARERAAERQRKTQDELAARLLADGEFPPEPESRRVVERWSRRSRGRMTRALCELDYQPLLRRGVVPAMVTLTYPGDWLTVAPDGAAVKRHLRMLGKRWARAWGAPLVGVWKLEFQARGAPHFHLFTVPPRGVAHDGVAGAGLAFKDWLSLAWAAIVDHPDAGEYLRHLAAGTGVDWREGLRHRDPKRIAVYFTKHGTFSAKEYQHRVPAPWQEPGRGPGRFWGYWGLHRLTRAAELGPESAIWAARLMRRYARAQGTTRQVQAPRTRGGRAVAAAWEVIGLAGAQLLAGARHTSTRRVRRRVRRMATGAGWLSVNNGATFGVLLARFLHLGGPAYA